MGLAPDCDGMLVRGASEGGGWEELRAEIGRVREFHVQIGGEFVRSLGFDLHVVIRVGYLVLVIGGIECAGDAELAKVGYALRGASGCADPTDRTKDERGKNADDGDDRQ